MVFLSLGKLCQQPANVQREPSAAAAAAWPSGIAAAAAAAATAAAAKIDVVAGHASLGTAIPFPSRSLPATGVSHGQSVSASSKL